MARKNKLVTQFTTIRITMRNKRRLGNLGTTNDDFDSVISKLLDDKEKLIDTEKDKE